MFKFIVAILSILLVLLLMDLPAAEAHGGGYHQYGGADAYYRYEVNYRNGYPPAEYARTYRYTCPRANGCKSAREIHYNRAGCICFRPMPRYRRHSLPPYRGRHGGFGRYHRFYRSGGRRRCW
ncbi:MAG: hypothetical protein FVQ82_00165 [Planctomycetes bacterium]|nr:hypothetical protein [Planctomycetota bacterium]